MKEDENEVKEQLKIKDLLAKIQILKNGVLSERQKNIENDNEIKRLKEIIQVNEKSLEDKELMIISLSKEIYELNSKVDIEKSRANSISSKNIFQWGNTNETKTKTQEQNEMKLIIQERNDLQNEVFLLKKSISDRKEIMENIRKDLDNTINNQSEKIKRLEQTIEKRNEELSEIKSNNEFALQKLENELKETKEKATNYEKLYNEYFGKYETNVVEIKNLKQKNEEKDLKIIYFIETLDNKSKEINELNKRIIELKNAIIDNNMIIQTFEGYKTGFFFNTPIEIGFQRDDTAYLVIIHEDNKSVKVNINLFDYVNINQKNLNSLDFCYDQNNVKVKFNVVFKEDINIILKIYDDYKQKALLSKDSLNYYKGHYER